MGHLFDTLAVSKTDHWMTPVSLLTALGSFDLDPCATPTPRPWPTAARHICLPDDGLRADWAGRVWLNPPYSDTGRWVGRLAGHGTGTALIFARTETQWFSEYVWARASALLFLRNRVSFTMSIGGSLKGHNAPAPSVLIAYGDADAERLAGSGIAGAIVTGWHSLDTPSLSSQATLFGGDS